MGQAERRRAPLVVGADRSKGSAGTRAGRAGIAGPTPCSGGCFRQGEHHGPSRCRSERTLVASAMPKPLAEAPGPAWYTGQVGRQCLARSIELPWGHGRALYERSGAAGGRAERVPQGPAALGASRPRTGRPWDATAPSWEGRASGLPRSWPGLVRDAPGRCRSLSCLAHAPTPPSLPPRPVGRRAGTSPAARTAGPGHVARGGQGSRGGAQGPATEAPAGSRRSRPSQVAFSFSLPGPRGPLFGLPVGDLYSVRHVEVPPLHRRADLDALGERLHDPATVLYVELVPLGRQVHRVRSRAL